MLGNLDTSRDALIALGRILKHDRGVTDAEMSMVMLAVLNVCSNIIATESQELLKTVAASLEAESATRQ
jgi:hypothetical protein